jgi:hypothetical protein
MPDLGGERAVPEHPGRDRQLRRRDAVQPDREGAWFGSKYVLAHKLVLDPSVTIDPADLIAITDIATKCAKAELGSIPPGPDGPGTWFKSRFTITSCDATAMLHDPTDVITSPGPSPVHPGTCH